MFYLIQRDFYFNVKQISPYSWNFRPESEAGQEGAKKVFLRLQSPPQQLIISMSMLSAWTGKFWYSSTAQGLFFSLQHVRRKVSDYSY